MLRPYGRTTRLRKGRIYDTNSITNRFLDIIVLKQRTECCTESVFVNNLFWAKIVDTPFWLKVDELRIVCQLFIFVLTL